ncbi:MAG: O-antigen ligase family protein [Candidatus Izemoplasmatales bacterium]|nr:O-antigen ligase family protein [Candidatus Izemoplasmatales bacterium]
MQALKRFFYSTPYLILVSALTLAIWTFQLEEILAPVLLGTMFLQFILLKDTIPTAAIFLNALFMIGNGYQNWTMETIPLYIYMTPVAILLGIILHLIRFKPRFFQGKMTVGILIMFFAVVMSTFNAAFLNLNYFFYMLVGTLYALVYFVYVGSFEGNHRKYLMTMFLLMGIVVSVEVFIYYLRVDDVLFAIENKLIHLGWGVSNYVATYLIMFIPASFYFAKTSKYYPPWVLLIVFQIVALAFTASRAGMIAFLLILPFLLVFLLYDKVWTKTVINLLLLVAFGYGIYFLNQVAFETLYLRLIDRGLDDTGRVEIWIQAWEMFLKHPLFGGGIFAKYDTVYRMYHNTVLHVMASMGIVGTIGLLHQLYTQFAVVIKRWSKDRIIFVIAMLGAHAHGMVDNIYIMPQFMVILMVIVAVFENANKVETLNIPQVG